MATKVQPASFGGYGRNTGPYGGIEHVEFVAQCPPDVQRGTRIVAVCGIPESEAAPQKDGWFFSDFFLFHQMLGSRAELPNQLWLSSCSPRDLVRKHGHYVHGPANGVAGDRRVVMSEDLLPANEIAAGFRTFKDKDLLERFLATLKSEIKEAARTQQPVLVFIFGHGARNNFGIFIGCDAGGTAKLTQDKLASVLQKDVQTTLVLTSCFSGGWIMMPNANTDFDVKPAFNHSFLTAASHKKPSLSWPVSESIGRQAGGSVFATCLLKSIITTSEGEDTSSQGQAGEKLALLDGNSQGPDFQKSMAVLAELIIHECKSRFGSIWESYCFKFAVQDDRWEEGWGKRTGLPLVDYRERWEALPVAPKGVSVYPPGSSLTGSIMPRTGDALHNIVRVKASRYMKSNPGLDNAGCNTAHHPGFYKLIEGDTFGFDELFEMDGVLDYRLDQVRQAEIYCSALGIAVTEGRNVDEFNEAEWELSLCKEKNEGSIERAKVATECLQRYENIWALVVPLFDEPLSGQGYDFSKPTAYLSAILAETRLSMEEIDKMLEALLQAKLQQAMNIARSPLGKAILNKDEVKSRRTILFKSVVKLRHRLRSMSPQKRTSTTA